MRGSGRLRFFVLGFLSFGARSNETEISFDRIQSRGLPVERFETLDHLRTVADAYEDVLAYCRSRKETIYKIDATQSIEEIHTEIRKKVQEYLGNQSSADC